MIGEEFDEFDVRAHHKLNTAHKVLTVPIASQSRCSLILHIRIVASLSGLYSLSQAMTEVEDRIPGTHIVEVDLDEALALAEAHANNKV